jgi:hypothetical protein
MILGAGDYLFYYDGSSTGTAYTGSTKLGAVFWDHAHFQDRFIMTLGDGTNPAQVITYDGSSVSSTDLNITTGPAEEDIRGVQVHKGRAYYWETASQSFWYASAGAYQGDLTEFDLGTVIKSGGALQMMVTLTIDGGGGQDDLACFIFSSGEVVVYQGDDPGDAAAWELVGVFTIGQPVDPLAHEKVAGTELVFTRDGVVDLSAALQLGRFGESAEFSNKITNAVTQAAKDFTIYGGWQVIHSPGDNCVLLNIPTNTPGTGFKQYIRETDTGGWWECKNWNTRFTVYDDSLHCVFVNDLSQLQIYKCFEGGRDLHIGDSVFGIECSAIPAFSTMRNPSQRKILTAVKPFTNIGETSGITIYGRADFDDSFGTSPGTSVLNPTDSRTSPNISAFANGHFISYSLIFSSTSANFSDIRWNSTTMFYENAGSI